MNKWKTISKCPPVQTTEYWDTKKQAEEAIKMIDELGCGSQCLVDSKKVMDKRKYHYIVSPNE